MNEEQARQILSAEDCDEKVIRPDDSLHSLGWYLAWAPDDLINEVATLDGEFTEDQLEAIAWWMRNKRIKK